jgi:hypothetical protein
MKARRLLSVLPALCLFGLAAPAFATNGTITGGVNVITAQATAVGNTFIELSSTVTIGHCNKDGGNSETLILIPDDDRGKQMMSIAQAALLSGKTVKALVDDGGASGGTYCFASWLSISP